MWGCCLSCLHGVGGGFFPLQDWFLQFSVVKPQRCSAAPHLFGAGEQPSAIICPSSQHISCAAVSLPAMLSTAAQDLGGHLAQQALDVAVALIGGNESSGAHRLAQALQTEQATHTSD